MIENHDVIYLGQVQGKENTYGIIHHTQRADHLSFDLNYDNLTGYLEAAFAFCPWKIELANGIPPEARKGSYPEIKISQIDYATLDKILDDAGIRNKLEFSIMLY